MQLLVLLPPLEHAPDQITERPLVALKVIELLVAKLADAVLPTATLMPAGLDSTCSPLRPVAVTVKIAFAPGGLSESVALRVVPPKEPEMLTAVAVVTEAVVTVKVALVAPAGTVTLAGTVATAVLLLESVTTAPPEGAAALKVADPVEEAGPTTLAGLKDNEDKLAAAAIACGVKLSVAENGPNTPAAFCARTRHHKRFAGRPPMLACDALTI